MKLSEMDLFDLTPYQVLGICGLGLAVGLTSAGGQGGGALILPIVHCTYRLSLKESVILVYVLSLSSSVGSLSSQILTSSGKPTQLINQQLIIFCLPMLTLGSITGTITHDVLPDIFSAIFVFCVSSISVSRLVRKYNKMIMNESLNRSLLGSFISVQEYFAEQTGNYGYLILLFFFIMFGFQIVRKFIQPLDDCWIIYSVLMTVYILYCFCFLTIVKKLVQQQSNICNIDPEWKNKWVAKVVGNSFVGGFFNGLIGTGSSTIQVPAWLQIEFLDHNQVTASSLTCVFMGAFSSLLISMVNGMITVQQVTVFFLFGLFCSLIISTLVTYLIKKYNKQSLLVLLLLINMTVGMFWLPLQITLELYEHPKNMWQFSEPQHICNN